MENVKQVVIIVMGVVLILGVIYGGYWIAKSVSYTLFYQGMVEETVRELVKKSALK